LFVLLVSVVVGRWLERVLEPRVRSIRRQPRLLRFLALLLRRVRWILAAILLGSAILVIRSMTFAGQSAIVAIAAWLIAAWVAISIVSRLIRNRTFARIVAGAAWIFVALRITGAWDEAARGLDALAIQIGAFRISVYDVVQATVIITVVLWLARLLGNFLERRIAASSDLTPSLKVLVGKLVKIALLVAAGAIALSALGIDLTALTVFSGAVGVGLGFGLQKVVSNFVSGIIILLDKSIKPADTIELGETFGWVRSLRSRFVSVMTRDGTEYLVPNEDFITQRVVSWSHTDTLHRLDVCFGVAPGFDPHEVRRVAIEAAKALDRVQERPQPVCHITKFDGSAVEYILRFWIADPQNGITNIRGSVLLACWDAFKAAGFELPLETRALVIRHPVSVKLSRDPDEGARP
jgi:small-conductance mechanosensitive channel